MNTEPVKAIAELDDLKHTKSVRARTKAFFNSRSALTKPVEMKRGWLKRFQERNLERRRELASGLNDENFSVSSYWVGRLWFGSRDGARSFAMSQDGWGGHLPP